MSETKKKRRGEHDSGLIRVRVDCGVDENGKRIRKVFYGKTRREAEEKADIFRARYKKGAPAKDIAVYEWARQWIEVFKADISHSTHNNYRAALNKHIIPAIGSMSMRDVRLIDVQSILNNMTREDESGKKLAGSKSSIDKVTSTLKQMFNAARKNKLIDEDPTLDIEKPAGTKGTHRSLSRGEIILLANHWQVRRAGIWAMIMLFAGLRRGEALALTWDDIDYEKKIITVSKGVHYVNNRPIIGKTKTIYSNRIVPLSPILESALCEHQQQSTSNYICTSARNTLCSERAFDRGWESLNLAMSLIANGDDPTPRPGKKRSKTGLGDKQIDIIDVKWYSHDMRHTFATMLYDAEVDVLTAQRYMGHDSPETTMAIYTHLSNERKKLSRERFDAFMSAGNLLADNPDPMNDP